MLDCKEKYNPWMEEMKVMLESKNMTGFVDGSLKDPDPKGESKVKNVKIYSMKWEKFDTQVMEWIRDSLDDTLKEVVKDSKTSKDMWYMLRTYFSTDTREISSAELRGRVSSKLLDINKVHYNNWAREMKDFLNAKGMLDYVNGHLKDRGRELQDVWNCSEEPAWSKGADKQVMDFIMASLDDIPKNMVKEMKTAKELWDTLETFFSTDAVTEIKDTKTDKTLLPDLGGMSTVGTIAKGKGIKFKEMNTGEASSSNSGTSNVGTIREELGPLDSNSLPKLKYETTYIEWKEQTESFLVEKKMAGFIDGTFRNPSEFSQSIKWEDKDIVKKYSERWTLLDQRVMKLIKSSLSVILHDIVKDLKSSKEVWHALEILYTTGYPLPSPVNEASFLSIKLSGKKNYIQWAQQIKNLLELLGLQNLIDPLSRPPPATFGNHADWEKYNQLLKGWIISSLAQNVVDKLTPTRILTATGLWGEIKNLYGPSEEFQITNVNSEYNQGKYTRLYTAILSGDTEKTILELNDQGFDVPLNLNCHTPLHVIIGTRKVNHVYFEEVLNHVVVNKITQLTEAGTSRNPKLVDLVDRYGRNTLHRAAVVGNLNAAKRLVDKDPYLLYKEDNDKCLPIHVAISTHHKDTFRYILIASKKYFNTLNPTFGPINPFEGEHGVRLLNAAIEAGYMEVAYQLIKMNPQSKIASGKDENKFKSSLHKTVENYDKYCSLPISWRIFDQDVGMKFKDTEALEAATETATETNETLPRDPPNHEMQNVKGDRWYSKPWKARKNLSKATTSILPTTTAPAQAPVSDSQPASALAPTTCSFAKRILGSFLMFLWNRMIVYPSLFLLNWMIVFPFKVCRYYCRWIKARVCGSSLYLKRRVKRWICAWVNEYRLYMKRSVSAIAVPNINSLPEDEVAHNKSLRVLRSICNQISLLPTNLEKHRRYQFAACVAARKDQYEALKEIAEHFPETAPIKGDGYNLMQWAIKYRSEKVFNFLAFETKVDSNFFKLVKTEDGTNLLHLAGGLTPIEKLDKDSGAALQMRKEVKWFMKVEKFALPGSNNEKNNMDETPMMVFRREHADLKKRGEEWMKTAANSYIIVAALIITITFAAIITVPGGSQQDSGDQNNVGLPVYIKNNHFKIFVYSDMVSFCGATVALMMFLSILTSRYTEEDFINKLPLKLTFGLLALVVSLVGMMVAFGETLHLMLGHKDISLLIVMGTCIGLPILTFIYLQLRMIWKIFF